MAPVTGDAVLRATTYQFEASILVVPNLDGWRRVRDYLVRQAESPDLPQDTRVELRRWLARQR